MVDMINIDKDVSSSIENVGFIFHYVDVDHSSNVNSV